MDILTIVADSCRYDTAAKAQIPAIRQYFDIVPATAQATFTYPAHMAMFAGFYPSANETNRPLYNRFTMSLFRWFYSYSRPHLIQLNQNTSIPKALQSAGWDTQCVGGVGWFKTESLLRDGFSQFRFEPNLNTAIDLVIGRQRTRPSRYCLLNTKVTHRPYSPPDHNIPSPRSGFGHRGGYDAMLHGCQIAALEYVSLCLDRLFRYLLLSPFATLVCFCSDHGDCFGEDGYYGHGFYHPKVMEVPLAWSCFVQGECIPITPVTIDRVKKLVREQNSF